jgi:hypothetical protein
LQDAAKAVGKHYTGISAALRGLTASAYGFIWKRGWGKAQLDLSNYTCGEELRAQRRLKPVKQYSAKGKYLQTFPSAKDAAAAVGVSRSFISTVLNTKKLAKGFYWMSTNK